MARRTLWLGQTLFILLICCAAAIAEDGGKPLKLDKETSRYNLKGHLELYEDKTGGETIDSVQTKTFLPTDQAALSLGYTRSAYWIKLVVENVTQQPETLRFQISNHYLDFIDIFVKSDRKSLVEHRRAGARVPFDERFSQDIDPTLDLHFAPYERKTIFVRIQSQGPLRIPLTLSTPEAYEHDNLNYLFFSGIFYGVMIVLIVYNIFSWSILKQDAYLYYILQLVFALTYHLGYDGLVPHVSIFSQPERMLHVFTATIALVVVFYILFIGSFLDARPRHPVLYRIMDVLWIGSVAIFVLFVINAYLGNQVIQVCGIIVTSVLVVITGVMWYEREAYARFVFLGNLAAPVFAALHSSLLVGILPYNPLLLQSLKVGFLVQGAFFTLALADRYAIIQRSAQKALEQEVTERSAELVRANEKLHNEKDRAEKYLDIAGAVMVAVDTDGRVTLINRRGCEVLEISPDQMMGKDWFETCVPERNRKRARSAFSQCMSGQIDLPEYFEGRIVTRSGDERHIVWHYSLIKDQRGNILGALGSGEDITDRKQAEEALKATESRFTKLTELLPQAVFEMDSEGKLTFANRAGFELTGYSEEDLAAGLTAFQVIVPQDRERAEANMARMAQGEKLGSNEYACLRKDGTTFPAVVYSAPIITDGAVHGFRGTVVDVTPLKNAEALVRESYKKLEDYAQSLELKVQGRAQHLQSAHEELDAYSKKIEYANEALRNLISGIEQQNRALIERVGGELRATVIPLLHNLAAFRPDEETTKLVDNVQDCIQAVVTSLSPFVDEEALLTPLQARMCEMIASGLSSKEIAAILGVTPQAISFHRHHIRKKLGLTGTGDDLASFLRNKMFGRLGSR
ncbi:MAG: PAS domain S-box protein [Thermodesulfobacteriota bacterium]